MSLWRIVLKSLRQHALSTAITSVSIALAAGLLMAVWSVKEQAQATFTQIDTDPAPQATREPSVEEVPITIPAVTAG